VDFTEPMEILNDWKYKKAYAFLSLWFIGDWFNPLRKMNTFTEFIACSEYLIAEKKKLEALERLAGSLTGFVSVDIALRTSKG